MSLNVYLSLCWLYVHDLFSRAIYCCRLPTLQSTLCALSWNASAHFLPAFPASFQSIDPGQQFTWEHSNLEVNKTKNRYANVIAYDHTRVILAPIEGEDWLERISRWRKMFRLPHGRLWTYLNFGEWTQKAAERRRASCMMDEISKCKQCPRLAACSSMKLTNSVSAFKCSQHSYRTRRGRMDLIWSSWICSDKFLFVCCRLVEVAAARNNRPVRWVDVTRRA